MLYKNLPKKIICNVNMKLERAAGYLSLQQKLEYSGLANSNKICLAAPLKLTNENVTFCLLHPHKKTKGQDVFKGGY